jgi:large subunit ribosomal protein L18
LTKEKKAIKKSEAAAAVGEELGQALLKKNIKTAVFDRGRFAYHGRVAQVAEGLRKSGIAV